MTLIGSLREPPSRTEAEAFLARFVASLEARRPWFEAEVTAAGGPALNGTTASLDALGDFVAAHVTQDRPAEPPEWFGDVHRREGWTAYGAALAEGLMAYLTDIYRARTGASWELDTDRKSAYYHQPVLSIRALGPPWRQVEGSIANANAGGGGTHLTRAAETCLAAVARTVDDDSPRLEITVDRIRHPDWDMEAFLSEEAEDVLGTERFLGLVHRFQALEGIKDAVHEDREVFLLRTARGTDPRALGRKLQAILDEAVAEAGREEV
ncbi:MAG TPA: hypothetical protein VHF27_02425 [Acidimicrobiales bacterium]|nr:hypothetical protein [Acidimicrobiales bacterium]